MMDQHAGNRQFVREAMSVLTARSTANSTSAQVMAKAFHAALFGYLAQRFKKDLVDPFARPPTARTTFT